MPDNVVIRAPRLDEISKLAPIEEDADRRYLDTRFHEFAVTSGIPADVAERYIAEDRLLVAAIEDEPVAFIGWHTEADATVVGISQVSVLTTFGRQGIGTSLIEAVMLRVRAEGYRSVVLATQIDVPWNEPWYRRLGFESVQPDDWTDWMRAGAADQQSDGIDWTDRVWMTRDLSYRPSSTCRSYQSGVTAGAFAHDRHFPDRRPARDCAAGH